MEQRRLYVVRGAARNGIVTYKCPTADWALRKLRDFRDAERQDITVTDPDGVSVTEADLVGIVDGSGAPPSGEAIPAASQITRQTASAKA
ncbi:hypothetical protein MKK69_29130 [Methylobacterium sp. J-026]|uniref:hypothetical protein n=1 Tax=Methylobacterium sp. J-026 TaxID=2836624 RepID=UPI001FBA31BC|nr:hypothetical protein [Methylobacterium sp. J-026]MCJ2138065.1 hypothetical protein [Methylobacterium sp. J-026]